MTHGAGRPPSARHVDVLLVEDDPSVSLMYQTRLEADGYRVGLAADGQQGIDLALSLNPRVIVLDVQLPRRDGFEVLSILRGDAATRGIPVLLLSNFGDGSIMERGRQLGAEQFLLKVHTTPAELSAEVGPWVHDAAP
jgi:DNA-binding response OmpR family regulator